VGDGKNNIDKFGFARRGFGERVRELLCRGGQGAFAEGKRGLCGRDDCDSQWQAGHRRIRQKNY